MSTENHDATGSQSPSSDPVDKGLAEAFGKQTPATGMSVLRALQARANSRLGVHLDSQGLDDVLVKVTDEARKLKDPSGRYQVLGEIGRGGVGTVYKGRDHDLGRDVAMKVLRDEFAERPDVLARFVEEAQIGGQLQHPGIVPVYELGLQAGQRPYFAMKLIKGETLAAQLARRHDPARDRHRLLGIFEQVCQTIAYAHARRVVHRDLKPANVMIGAFGEVQVVDWGFAKVLPKGGVVDEAESIARQSERSVIETVRSKEGSGSASVAGSMLGTPAYMPPEQALGDVEHVDQRSDVFALGAILCEILTGEPPYREQDGDLVRQASTGAIGRAFERLRGCGADDALVKLSRECLAPSRRARPESAAEVADRIGSHLTSVEERAHKAEVSAAEARYRNRMTVLAAAAALLLVALGAGSWIWLQSAAQQRRAEVAQQVATAMNDTSRALGKAQAPGDDIDITLWDAADQRAENLALLLQSDDVETEVREKADALLDQVEKESRAARAEAARQQRDQAMVARLVDLRMPVDDELAHGRGWQTREWRRLDAEYTAAFSDHLRASPLDQSAAKTLAGLSRTGIALEIATSIDHWCLARAGLASEPDAPDARATARLREVAAVLDGQDPWRTELRRLLPDAADKEQELRELADRADLAEVTGSGCRVLAEALWRVGAEDRALELLIHAQEAHPQDFDLCFRLAFSYERLEQPRWEDAVRTYRIAHALKPEHNEVLHRQGIALQNLGRLPEAERMFSALAKRDSQNAHWFSHLCEVQGEMGKRDEAYVSAQTAYRLEPDHPRHLNNLAVELERRERRTQAIELLERALAISSQDVTILTNLGSSLNLLGQHADAEARFREALAIDSGHVPALRGLFGALSNQGELREAHDELSAAVARNGENAVLKATLAESSLQLNRMDDAVEQCRAALAIDDDLAIAHFTLGQAYARNGQRERAIEHYRRAAALDLDPRKRNNLAGALLELGLYDEAEHCIHEAIAAAPHIPHARVTLGDLLRLCGQYEEAIQSYRDAIEIVESSSNQVRTNEIRRAYWQAHHNKGIAFELLGKDDEAMTCYERALEVDPSYAASHSTLADVYLRKGDVERAVIEYERAAELFAPQDTQFARTWGDRARIRVEILRATPAILDGRRLPESTAEYFQVGLLLYEAKRHREVVALTERILQADPDLVDDDPASLYNAACSAALLASDPTTLKGTEERSRLRGLARSWLARATANAPRGLLRHSLQDPDFASVRGAELELLPEEERGTWKELWATIERALEEDGR